MKDVVYNVYGAVEAVAADKKIVFKTELARDLPVCAENSNPNIMVMKPTKEYV
jgi:hypothetical protein